MDRRALCVLCRARPVEARWRPFCSRRCQQQDQARWADGSYRVDTPSAIFQSTDDLTAEDTDTLGADDNDDDG